MGKVRDVDVVVDGVKGKFEVQLRAGVWGMDLAVPLIEGVMAFGVASSAELHSATSLRKESGENRSRDRPISDYMQAGWSAIQD